jgi:hypothetical protein
MEARVVSAHFSWSTSLIVKLGRAQIFFAAAALFASSISIFAQLEIGQTYRIALSDVDGNNFSTADGRITVLALTNRANIDKARAVGDRIPDFCLANPTYRMITVVAFEKNHSKPMRAILSSLTRRRLDREARRLQSRYDEMKISRTARQDVFAAADFDGAITSQLGATWDANLFRVFVFGKNGQLLKQWSDVPSAEDLAAALK